MTIAMNSTPVRLLIFAITISKAVRPLNSLVLHEDSVKHFDDEQADEPYGTKTYLSDPQTVQTSGNSLNLIILDTGSTLPGNMKGLYQNQVHNQTCSQRLTSAHCACLGLTEIPGHLSPDITFLNLSNNHIASIPNGTFLPYSKLNVLTLEANNLSDLYPDSFVGLGNLKYLNLRNNHLKMPDAFPKGVFRPLSSLLHLNIQMKNRWRIATDASYPETELVQLRSLRVLCMDGLSNQTFGEGFRNMTSLRSLVMSGFDGSCNLTTVRNATFEHLGQITTLVISNCSIHSNSLPDDIFVPLTRLFSLDIQDNHNMGFKSFMRVMSPLKNSNLRFLFANAVISRYSLAITVNTTLVEMLPRSLVYLEARENCFESVDPDIFPRLPKGLRYLDVGNNRLLFGDYLRNLTWMKSLTTLMLNGETFLTDIPRRFEHMDGLTAPPQLKSSEVGDVGADTAIAPLVLHLPPGLVEIDLSLSGLKYIVSELSIDKSNVLDSLSLSMNYLPVLKGPVTGITKVKRLDLSYCSVREISFGFFRSLPSLERLILAYNNLNFSFSTQPEFSPFQDLGNLRYLDLSHNQLTALPSLLFKGLEQLEVLDMHQNRMWKFDVVISHMVKLRELTLTNTEISGLPVDIRSHIDFLSRRTEQGVTIDLSHNPLHCDCDNFDFLQWMVNSGAFDKTFPFYMCSYPDTSFKVIQDQYARDLKHLTHACTDHYMLFLTVLLCTLSLFSVVIVGILYRFRWKLRYLYYMAYRNVKEKRTMTNQGDFKCDVFICYANQDERFILSEIMTELPKRGLKLYIHGRDFAVGDLIASNIVTAIHESRKTLVILTRSLLASKWCKFELQMANMEAVHTGRQVLAFLLKESIPSSDLGTDLLYHVRNNTYLLYPQSEGVKDEGITKAFWDKLANDLRYS